MGLNWPNSMACRKKAVMDVDRLFSSRDAMMLSGTVFVLQESYPIRRLFCGLIILTTFLNGMDKGRRLGWNSHVNTSKAVLETFCDFPKLKMIPPALLQIESNCTKLSRGGAIVVNGNVS
jgi:hypothetical protein